MKGAAGDQEYSPLVPLQGEMEETFSRITSYNVCYTKLLRFDWGAVASLPWVWVEHGSPPYDTLLREFGRLRLVITSYSIHYTKLYDSMLSSSPARPSALRSCCVRVSSTSPFSTAMPSKRGSATGAWPRCASASSSRPPWSRRGAPSTGARSLHCRGSGSSMALHLTIRCCGSSGGSVS